jgi:hypothetical protein
MDYLVNNLFVQTILRSNSQGVLISMQAKEHCKVIGVNVDPPEDALRTLYPQQSFTRDPAFKKYFTKAIQKPQIVHNNNHELEFVTTLEDCMTSTLASQLSPFPVRELLPDLSPSTRLFNAYCQGSTSRLNFLFVSVCHLF